MLLWVAYLLFYSSLSANRSKPLLGSFINYSVAKHKTLFFQSEFYTTVTDHKLCSDMASLTLIRSRDLHWVTYFTLCVIQFNAYRTLQN